MQYRYSFQDIQAAAQHNWQHILERVGVPVGSLKNKHQPCPMCGGKDRFRFDDKGGNGTYFCNQCGSGNGFTFIQRYLNLGDFGNAVSLVAQVLGMGETSSTTVPIPLVKREPQPTAPPKDELAKLLNVWNAATPIVGTPAEKYLLARGISQIPHSPNLRYHSHLAYWHDGKRLGEYAALLGLMSDTQGEIKGIQRVYIQQDPHTGKWGKAIIHDPETGNTLDCKKQMARYSGSTRGTAVHIDEPSSETGFLLVAEGIETALAAREIFGSKVATWATVNAGNMARLVLPSNLKRLLIAADNDHSETGYRAARDLAIKAIKQDVKVQTWQPENAGQDALDELNRMQSPAYAIAQNLKPKRTIIPQAFIQAA